MKTTIITLALLVAFVATNSSAQSQEKKVRNMAKTENAQQQTKAPGPNFIDADNDGICDNYENGTPIRKRLRDGSCGNTPTENCTGTGTGTGTPQRRRGGK